jgi:hypothetical protein
MIVWCALAATVQLVLVPGHARQAPAEARACSWGQNACRHYQPDSTRHWCKVLACWYCATRSTCSASSGSTQPTATVAHVCLVIFCLLQIRYMLGEGGRSYVVGYGDNFPKKIQHRESSCPAAGPCNWRSAYYPALDNPG